MSWKVTECYLVALIGIIVLACWETKDDRMLGLHVAGIIVLAVFILLMPSLTCRYVRIFENAKKDAETRDFLKEYIRSEEMKKVYQAEDIKRMKEDCKQLKSELEQTKSKLDRKAEDCQKRLSDFYNFLLVKLAEEKDLLFSKKGFEKLNEEFQKKQ